MSKRDLRMTKSLIKRILVVFLALMLGFRNPDRIFAATSKQDLENANSAKAAIDKKMQDVKDQLAQLNKDKTNIEKYISELDKNLAAIDTDIDNLNTQIGATEIEIEKSKEELEIAQKEQNDQYEAMKLRIKYMYESGSESSYLKMLLEAKSMSDLLNKAEYINRITQYDRKMLDEFAEVAKKIEETKALLEEDLASLEEMKIDVQAQREALALVQETKVKELGSLNSKNADAKNYYSQLEAEAAQQEKEIRAIEAELKRQEEEARKAEEAAKKAGTTPAVTVQRYDGGKFKWPTPSTRITSPYGDKEDRSSAHKGVDIGAQKIGVSGDPIYAAYGGTVVTSTYSSSAGNYIMINHGDGLMTVYMHCSQLLVSPGQKVNQGDKIALMGTTGNSTGVHLHFGVRLNGNYVNPMSYFG